MKHALKIYLIQNEISLKDFSTRLDFNYNYLVDVVAGRKKCGKKLAKYIERETNGQIKAADLLAGGY